MRALIPLFLLLLAACGSTKQKEAPQPPTSDGLAVPQEKQALLNEWLRGLYRERIELVSDHLKMRLSHELVDRLTIRETPQYHRRTREQQGNVTLRRYSNTRGGLDQPLEFRIGKARFVVLGSAELRLVKSKKAELEISLRGKVEGRRGGIRFQARRFEFRDGSWGSEQ